MTGIREHAAAIRDTARSLTLVYIADLGHAIAAWAESRDLDTEWTEEATR